MGGVADRLRAWLEQGSALADEVAALEAPAPPAPAPSPAPAPAPEPPAPAPQAAYLQTILTDTGPGGPTKTHWSSHLFQRWRNPMADWLDAVGVAQGSTPFASAVVSGPGEVRLDVSEIVRTGAPIILRSSGKASPKAAFAGRLSATPPRIEAFDVDGNPVPVDVLAFACWFSSQSTPSVSTQTCTVASNSVGAVSYTAAGVARATLVLQCVSVHNVPTISAFQCDAQPCRVGAGGLPPELGLAAEAGSEAALASHTGIHLACDFSDIKKLTGWGETVPAEFLPDPLDPARVIVRGRFMPGKNGSLSFGVQLSTADLTDPLRPIKFAPLEIYTRMCVFLADDWLDVWQDGQKLGPGCDQRFGYLTSRDYWQRTTGNGGQRGTGLKLLRPPGYFQGMPDARYEYQGHMQRMEVGRGIQDPTHPYRALRPVQTYAYHNDQLGPNGQLFMFSGAVMPIGRWVCIEQYVRTNSIEGPFDAMGNGQAVADGLMRTWVNGRSAGEVKGLRWRRHPDMGLEGPSVVWYYGGKSFPPHQMTFLMADLAVGSRYIGPPANFHLRNP